jgi:hypothetical protein
MKRCGDCGAYLRKIKLKKSPELTFDEADKVLDCFGQGDLEVSFAS